MRDLIENKKLLICVGAGGVGKTSLSATIGLQAAVMGRKVLVLTIDPAKRLANSLGLEKFGNTETKIDLSSIDGVKGELWAMMLDGQKTFDELIANLSDDEETKQRILNNNILNDIHLHHITRLHDNLLALSLLFLLTFNLILILLKSIQLKL